MPANEVELQSGLTTTPTGTAAVSLPFVIRRNRAFVPEGYVLAFRNANGGTYREALALVQRDGSAQAANLAVEVMGDIDRLELTTINTDITEHRRLVFLVPGAGADTTVRATTLNTLETGVAHPAGTPRRARQPGGILSLGLDVAFANGLPGRWTENRPAALLSQRAGCGTN